MPGERPRIRRREPFLSIPPVTLWLIVLNVAILGVLRLLPSDQANAVVDTLGFDPATLDHAPTAIGLVSLITYQFLHAGWNHLIVNMVSLLAFGSGIERSLGRGRYILLYLVSGIAGALLQGSFTPAGEEAILIGASGSISGLFGALIALWTARPQDRSLIRLIPLALLWIGVIVLTGVLGVGAEGIAVAWIAHIGGFLVGLTYGLILRLRQPR
jgi:membrane associated rhomboid family serine protease